MDTINCPECKGVLPDGVKFCSHCGAKLIKCPNCNKSLSSKAKFCVNCGVKIVTCPECGTLCSGNTEACLECGFVLTNSTADSYQYSSSSYQSNNNTYHNASNTNQYQYSAPETKEANKFEGSVNELVARWRSEGVGRKVFWNPPMPLSLAKYLFLLPLALAGFLISDVDDLLEVLIVYGVAKTCVSISAILLCISSFIGIYSKHYAYRSFGRWLEERKIDLRPIIIKERSDANYRKLSEEERDKITPIWKMGIRGSFYNSHVAIERKNATKTVWSAIIRAVGRIVFCAFLGTNVLSAIYAVVYGKFEFGMIQNWWLFIAFVVISIIAGMVEPTHEEEQKWVGENMPEMKDDHILM